jgi:hypothetical protein
MFWMKVKLAVAALAAAAAVTAAVPVTVGVMQAAEETRKPEPAAQVPPEAGERELAWREVGTPFLYSQCRPKPGKSSRYFRAWWDRQAYDGDWEVYGDAGHKRPSPPELDFGSKMAIYWRPLLSVFVKVERICETEREVRVHYAARPQLAHEDRDIDRGRLLEVERCEKPVAFLENGREVARVPLAPAGADQLAEFLLEVRFASRAALGVVVGAKQTMDEPLMVRLGAREEEVLYGTEGEKAHQFVLTRPGERLDVGDKVILSHRQVATPLDVRDRYEVLEWSPQREKAVRFALAPGWVRNPFSLCPWCRHKNLASFDPPAGWQTYDLQGRCVMCARTVGPATRGVELLLGTKNPLRETRDIDSMKLTVAPGKSPRVHVAARLAEGVGGVSELVCPGTNFQYSRSLLFLVARPGAREPVAVFPSLPKKKWASEFKPLKSSATASVPLAARDAAGRPVFDKPGAYVVRAAAGRLLSNPVTVVVGSPRAGQAAAAVEFRRLRHEMPPVRTPSCIVARTREDAALRLAGHYQPTLPRVRMTPEEHNRSVAAAREAWLDAINPNWGRDMILAVSRGYFPGHTGGKFEVAAVRRHDDHLAVELTFEPPRQDPGTNCIPADMVRCARYDGRVVFLEGGKAIAEVPAGSSVAQPAIKAPPTQADAHAVFLVKGAEKRLKLLAEIRGGPKFFADCVREVEATIKKLEDLGKPEEAKRLRGALEKVKAAAELHPPGGKPADPVEVF